MNTDNTKWKITKEVIIDSDVLIDVFLLLECAGLKIIGLRDVLDPLKICYYAKDLLKRHHHGAH